MKTTLPLLVICLTISFCNTLQAQQTIFINELMASNDTTIADANGNFEDWFEIYNASSAPFDLTNFYVTDDTSEPTKFQFTGGLTVPANGYLIIWASGTTNGNDHIPFKLSASGESVYLYQPDGTTLIDSVSFGAQKTDVSYGRNTDGAATLGYFKTATPDASNNTSQGYLGFLKAPVFSVDAGFYANPFNLTITDADPGAQIIYTTNGSNPDANNLNGKVYRYKNKYPRHGELPYPFLYDSFKSQQYTQALQIIDATTKPNRLSLKASTYDNKPNYFPVTNINKSTLVRAVAVKNGYISSPENAATYFVTPNGVNHYTLPVISLGIQEDYMFNWDSGIYCAGTDFDNWRLANPDKVQNGATPANYQRETEYPVTIEFFEDRATTRTFEVNTGFQIHGGFSKAKPDKSLDIYCRSQYGASSINYKFFPNLPYNVYERITLRNSGNDENSTRERDMAIQTAVSHLKFDTQAARPAITFVNGEYTGLLNIRTKYSKYYFQHVYGIQDNELDLLEEDALVKEGDSTDYLNLRNYITTNSMTNAGNYDSVKKRMDIDNYIDYYISKIYFDCTDWPEKNIEYFRKRVPYTPDAPYGQDGRYRWIFTDGDSGLGGGGDSVSDNSLQLAVGNRLDKPRPLWSTQMFSSLTKNLDFRNSFVSRYCDLLNTSFLPARVISVINYYHDLLAPEMPEQIARWQNNPGPLAKWNADVNAIDTFAAQRPPYAFQYVQSFYSLGAKQQITLNVSDTSAGFVHINTIDITPAFPGVPQNAYPWSGYYFPDVPVSIIAMPKSGYHFLHWQGDDNSTNDSLSVTLTAAKSFTAIFEKDATAFEHLIDYWHFNNLPQPPVVITSVNADSSATGNAVITYPGTGAGYMDYTDTTTTGYTFGKQQGSNINIQLGQIPGNALRVRNPSNTRYLLIKAPTTGFTDIKVKYATVRTTKGAQNQRVSYTTDGSTWILKQDNYIPPFPDTNPFALDSLNFSDDLNVNNNPLFAVKVEFYGSQATGSSGNDRFDNITVSGNVNSCGVPSGLTATNITANTATVSWDAVSGANSYDVDYKIHTATFWTNAATATTSLTINLSSLSGNTLYDYRVRSTCSYGSGNYSASQFTTMNVCGIPSALTATNITASTAKVNWDAVTGANSYDVDYKIHTDAIWTNAASATTSLTVNLSGLSASTLYDYRVRSNCSFGSGDYDTSQFTTAGANCNSIYDGTTHNSFATAVPVPFNTNVNGTISSATDIDYYKFTITHAGTATVTLSTLPVNYDMYVYNNKFKQIIASNKTGTRTETKTKSYSQGTYYVKIVGVNSAFDGTNCYTLNVALGTASLLNSESPNISSAIADNSLHLFPNPVSSVLNVNTSGIESGAIIKVVDIFGKTVFSQRISSSNSKINVSKLASSTYLLTVLNKNGSIISTSKFVKQ